MPAGPNRIIRLFTHDIQIFSGAELGRRCLHEREVQILSPPDKCVVCSPEGRINRPITKLKCHCSKLELAALIYYIDVILDHDIAEPVRLRAFFKYRLRIAGQLRLILPGFRIF